MAYFAPKYYYYYYSSLPTNTQLQNDLKSLIATPSGETPLGGDGLKKI